MSADIDAVRRFVRETRFMWSGGATRRPAALLDSMDRVLDALEALDKTTVDDALDAKLLRDYREARVAWKKAPKGTAESTRLRAEMGFAHDAMMRNDEGEESSDG